MERTAAITSGMLILALLSLLVWDAVHEDRPPELRTVVGSARAVGSQHYLSVSVENVGDVAVRDVEIEVVLVTPDSTDRARFVIDWIPGRSVRHGVAIFPRPPSRANARAVVLGYVEP